MPRGVVDNTKSVQWLQHYISFPSNTGIKGENTGEAFSHKISSEFKIREIQLCIKWQCCVSAPEGGIGQLVDSSGQEFSVGLFAFTFLNRISYLSFWAMGKQAICGFTYI